METQQETPVTQDEIVLQELREIRALLDGLVSTLAEFRPLLDQYKQASQAGSFLAARRVMKEAKRG